MTRSLSFKIFRPLDTQLRLLYEVWKIVIVAISLISNSSQLAAQNSSPAIMLKGTPGNLSKEVLSIPRISTQPNANIHWQITLSDPVTPHDFSNLCATCSEVTPLPNPCGKAGSNSKSYLFKSKARDLPEALKSIDGLLKLSSKQSTPSARMEEIEVPLNLAIMGARPDADVDPLPVGCH